jgi:coenzyme F420-dependent glucose-6-phosphate dehydrogenase
VIVEERKRMVMFAHQLTYSAWEPMALINIALRLEDAGFDIVFNEDHFHPYLPRNTCACPWVVMPIILEKTRKVKVGPLVTTTLGGRYHPAVIAQMAATLDNLFPGRFILGLGTGEDMQTVPLGSDFPKYPERLQNMRETVEIIRRLWTEDSVTYMGRFWSLRSATLYTKPKGKIPILIAAHGPKTAKLAGEYADIVDVEPIEDKLGREIIPAVKEGAKRAGRRPDEIKLCGRLIVSIDEHWEKAFNAAKDFALGHYGIYHKRGFIRPEQIREYERELGEKVYDLKSELYAFMCVTTKAEDVIRELEKIKKMGVEIFLILNCSPNPLYGIEVFKKEIIPYFKGLERPFTL